MRCCVRSYRVRANVYLFRWRASEKLHEKIRRNVGGGGGWRLLIQLFAHHQLSHSRYLTGSRLFSIDIRSHFSLNKCVFIYVSPRTRLFLDATHSPHIPRLQTIYYTFRPTLRLLSDTHKHSANIKTCTAIRREDKQHKYRSEIRPKNNRSDTEKKNTTRRDIVYCFAGRRGGARRHDTRDWRHETTACQQCNSTRE